MSTPHLSRLERVPVRDCWQDEARDFTPWLAGDDNIALLGETIGIDLEVQEQEARVGPFRADILCRDTATDSLVLIENQLERTDHTHLGQLFTYAAGLNAVTVIWIAQRFTDEHRAALDWLNRITHEGFHFFGIEIELWRIGDSNLAPKFSLVSNPNDWSKTVRAVAGPSTTERALMYREIWGALLERLDGRSPHLTLPPLSGANRILIGTPGGKATVSFAPAQNSMSVYLLFRGERPRAWSDFVRRDADAFHREVDEVFEWVDDGDTDDPWWYGVRSHDFDHEQPAGSASTLDAVAMLLERLGPALATRKAKFDLHATAT